MDSLTYLIEKLFEKTDADRALFGDESSGKLPLFEERFCPNCGSNKVEPYQDHGKDFGALLFNLDEWKCRECDYTGIMPTRSEDGERELTFQPKLQEREDYSIEGLGKYLYQITVIILLIIAGYVWIILPLLV